MSIFSIPIASSRVRSDAKDEELNGDPFFAVQLPPNRCPQQHRTPASQRNLVVVREFDLRLSLGIRQRLLVYLY